MAITFSFSTTPVLAGHAIRIYNTSLNWSEYVAAGTSGTLTIKTKDGDLNFVGTLDTYTKSLVGADLEGDWYIDITATDLYGADRIIDDDILTIRILTTGTTALDYSTDEVFYYNAWAYKTQICFNTVNDSFKINTLEVKFACMVNILYLGLIADIASGNTTGIYNKINMFTRLEAQLV
jgi:hypothetical protein